MTSEKQSLIVEIPAELAQRLEEYKTTNFPALTQEEYIRMLICLGLDDTEENTCHKQGKPI